MSVLIGYFAPDARQMSVPSISVDLGAQVGVPGLVCTRESAALAPIPGPPPSVSTSHWGIAATTHGLFGKVLFERVLVIPRRKDVGFILSDTTFQVEVWNAFQATAKVLTEIPITGSGNLSMAGPAAMTYGPGQSQTYMGNLPSQGDATILALATWAFPGVTGADLTVMGTRITVFPHRPDWSDPFRVRKSWLTEIFPGYDDSEQRRSLRTRPRHSVSFRVLTTTPLETASMEALLYEWQARQFGVPIWPESTLLVGEHAIGSTTLIADTSLRPSFEVGGMVLLWSAFDAWEAFRIAGLVDGAVQLGSQTTRAWPSGARVVPLRRGYIQPKQQLGRPANWLSAGTVSFDCAPV